MTPVEINALANKVMGFICDEDYRGARSAIEIVINKAIRAAEAQARAEAYEECAKIAADHVEKHERDVNRHEQFHDWESMGQALSVRDAVREVGDAIRARALLAATP